VRLFFGPYEADVCPDMGANCIRFVREGLSVLRTPPDMDTFLEQPNVYGMPLLFPPNRIQGGTYTYQGRVYRFPINEPSRGHHIHGFLSSTPFTPAGQHVSKEVVSVSFQAIFDERSPYLAFPHAFGIRVNFQLNDEGLFQTLTLQNNSPQDMPAGLGFHTAFAVPFVKDTTGEEYRLYANVEEEICLDPVTIIPTGERRSASTVRQALRKGSLIPAGSPLSSHFSERSGEITLTHTPTGAAVHYLPDPAFSFLMLWNGGGQSGFVCPEPQTWQVDAPNSSAPPSISGFMALKPGGIITLNSKLCIDLGSA
jgi:aldose 1-epimerase